MSQEGPSNSSAGNFPRLLLLNWFVVVHWEGTDCSPREGGSPAQGRLNSWGLRSHQPHYFLKRMKCVQGLSCR